jgi:hypothetical protein
VGPGTSADSFNDVVLLLASQRTGTNALQAVLSTHPDIHCTREVFHPSPQDQPHLDPKINFFRFIESRGELDRTDASLESQRRIFLEFLVFLRASTTKRFLVIDVKYNATHHFDGPWRPLIGWPAMFGFAHRHSLRVLHLVRANHLRQHVSMIKAKQTQRWVVEGGESIDSDFAVTVPTGRLLASMRRLNAEDSLVEGAFAPHGRYLKLEYADVFGHLPQSVGAIARWLGVDDTFECGSVPVKKQAVLPLEQSIENFDEVAAALAGTRFAGLLEDEAF